MMHTVRIFWLHLKVTAMAEVQYRANFFLSLLQGLVALGMGLVVLALVFGQVSTLNGWTEPQMLAVLGTYTVIGGLLRALVRPNMARFLREVEDGALDFMLTKPADAQVLAGTREFAIWQGTDVVVGAVVLAVAVARSPSGVDAWDAAGFVVGLVLAGIMLCGFLSMLCTLAFWFTRVWQLADLSDGLFQAGRWPVDMYPGWLRIGLSAFVPVGTAVTVPAAAVASHLTATTLAGAAVLAALWIVAARLFWRAGVRRYTGASA